MSVSSPSGRRRMESIHEFFDSCLSYKYGGLACVGDEENWDRHLGSIPCCAMSVTVVESGIQWIRDLMSLDGRKKVDSMCERCE